MTLIPFLPIISDFINKYKVECEIKADKFAIEKVGSSLPLLSALSKILDNPTVKLENSPQRRKGAGVKIVGKIPLRLCAFAVKLIFRPRIAENLFIPTLGDESSSAFRRQNRKIRYHLASVMLS